MKTDINGINPKKMELIKTEINGNRDIKWN